jgi:hypothetical protein
MTFARIERILFYLLVSGHLLVLASLRYFVTHDGPAHTYNTVLMEDLLSGKELPVRHFFEFNSDPQPNWAYNAIMLAVDKVCDPVTAERVIIGLIVVVMAFSFRALIRQLSPANVFLSYLVLPFLFSFHLYIGFFNFCIGAAVFFFLLYYLVKKDKAPTLRYYITLSLLSILLLFSHAFSFMLFCLCVAGFLLVQHYFSPRPFWSRQFFRRVGAYLLALLPAGSFCLFFLLTRYKDTGQGIAWLSAHDMFKYLFQCGPAITLTGDPERVYGFTVIGLVVMNIVLLVHSRKKEAQRGFRPGDLWIIIALVTLVLYFSLPDTMGVWGFISLRTLMFFFLLLPLWLASGNYPAWWKYVQVSAMTVMMSSRLYFHYGLSKTLDSDAQEMVSLQKGIRPGSVILPLDYYTNWMHDNISNYLGLHDHDLVLDNYEAVFPHFPLCWKTGANAYKLVGNFAGRVPPCANLGSLEHATGVEIDYVVRWLYQPDQDSCTAAINRELEAHYMLKMKSPNGMAELFERRPKGKP